MSKELDRLNQNVASLTGTHNDAKTVQEWTDRTIDGSTLLTPSVDKDIVSYIQAKAAFTIGRGPSAAILPSVGVGTFTQLALGFNALEMFGCAFGTLIVLSFSFHPFFWSRSKAGEQEKVLKANLENVVDKWLYERYSLEVYPSTRKKIIRNLLSYDGRTFTFKAIGCITAQMSCTEKGWFVHDIRSVNIRIPSIDDDLVRFALPKNESYQRVQISRNNRNIAIEKAQQREVKEQKIRDGLERAAEYSRNNRSILPSNQDKSSKEEIFRSYQQAKIDELMYQNHQLTEQLNQTDSKTVEKAVRAEKVLPVKVTAVLNNLEQRLNMLTELHLNTESTHIMERIQNESHNAIDVFRQLQKLNREKQGLAEVMTVLNGLVSDADTLLDAEANKLKSQLVTSEAFLKATRKSELRLENPTK